MKKYLKKIVVFLLLTVIGGVVEDFTSNPLSDWVKQINFKEKAIIVTNDIYSSVRIRTEPNYDDDSILELLKYGDEVIIVGTYEKFTEVVVKKKDGKRVNIAGYVDTRYIEKR
ncbi:hypothetical protein [Clostridium sp.]|uniref:hypothetical protein n=1 Tax=Clostridium sp. TaxID=1506 RepID=UPI001D8D4EF2|nr:hypothetical protein [Clostridium sp.]MBS5936811.1 hypothetical protein [Clostridium sp.]